MHQRPPLQGTICMSPCFFRRWQQTKIYQPSHQYPYEMCPRWTGITVGGLALYSAALDDDMLFNVPAKPVHVMWQVLTTTKGDLGCSGLQHTYQLKHHTRPG